MRIPETPLSVEALDLMKRLEDYADGRATWHKDGETLGPNVRKACRALHTHLVQIVDKVFAYILDRVTAREMDTFTMHDRVHGRKVAHLMWHIIAPERQALLTPPEIGVLVVAAHLHDAGMALSTAEREARLAPGSDLWERVEADDATRSNLKRIRLELADPNCPDPKRKRLEAELFQAEEVLLALDTRERHATHERYLQLIEQISGFHEKDKARIPDIEQCMSYDGDSFKDKLVDVCFSHNQDAEVLVEKDRETFERPRFPTEYPVGSANADLHLVAAALRLADILDFDRERTPPVLFHYLLPTTLALGDNISVLEWSKHLAICNWEIEPTAVVFRGRSKSHIVHHAVVQFCEIIEEEFGATHATFGTPKEQRWPFVLPLAVRAEIHEEGYHYVPYQFQLDDRRVYELLMGGAIYDQPLVALRELVQNAVDACRYRDAITKAHEPHVHLDTESRITIRYEDATKESVFPRMTVTDSGSGMDSWAIERWFLKVGRSFYKSGEFNRERIELRKHGCDFGPVSEFGIGFLSCFLLADRVEVETALWEPVRGDTRKRHLQMDGPTRLIRLRETANEGIKRFKGTRVSMLLTRGGRGEEQKKPTAPTWEEVRGYLVETCQELPYRLNLEHAAGTGTTTEHVDPRPVQVNVPTPYGRWALRIPVDSQAFGLQGEIAIVPYRAVGELNAELVQESPIAVVGQRPSRQLESVLLRGGFNVGVVPAIPSGHLGEPEPMTGARIRLLWHGNENRRYALTNLARNGPADASELAGNVCESWLRYLLNHHEELPDGFMRKLHIGLSHHYREALSVSELNWLEDYDAFTLYCLARNGWHSFLLREDNDRVRGWEDGRTAAFLPNYGELYSDLLELVLPYVVHRRRFTPDGYVYVSPPRPDWRDVLKSTRSFISNRVAWSNFVEYTGTISNRLFHEEGGYSDLFNIRYADRLGSFSPKELDRLGPVLEKLMDGRHDQRPVTIDVKGTEILGRAIAAAGDLEISDMLGCWPLNSFRVPAANAT